MAIIDEYTKACNIKTMNESDYFFEDLNREDLSLFGKSTIEKKDIDLKRLNQNVRFRREIVKDSQQKLKAYFYKYEQDLRDCFAYM